MNRLIMCLAVASAVFGLANSQAAAPGSQNASIITMPVNGSYSHTIKLNSAYAAESYLIGRLGQAYYNNYISLYDGVSYGNLSYVYFTYSVPFSNGSTISQLPSHRYLGITVGIDGSSVYHYIGPSQAYVIGVNRSRAEGIAGRYGITNSTAALVGLFGTNGTTSSNYSIAWAVLSGNPQKSQKYYGLYIDAVTGNAIGEFYYTPATMSNRTSYDYGTAGNFSLFYLDQRNAGSGIPSYEYVVLGFFAIIAVIIIGIKIRPKKRSRFSHVMR
ncbi:MAG: hypothetical protein ACYCO0_02080 [Candidatus Micrarchaeaceae archaeon]